MVKRFSTRFRKKLLLKILDKKEALFATHQYANWEDEELNIAAIKLSINPVWFDMDMPSERYCRTFAFLNS